MLKQGFLLWGLVCVFLVHFEKARGYNILKPPQAHLQRQNTARISCHRSFKSRSLKGYDLNNFQDIIDNINWVEITNICDVDISWDRFQTTFLEVLDKIAPLKETRIKQRSQPWINNDILDTIHLRDNILSEFKITKLPGLFKEYKTIRNKVQRMVDEAKNDFF